LVAVHRKLRVNTLWAIRKLSCFGMLSVETEIEISVQGGAKQ